MEQSLLEKAPAIAFALGICSLSVLAFIKSFFMVYDKIKKNDTVKSEITSPETVMPGCSSHIEIEKKLSMILERITSIQEVQKEIKNRLDKEFEEIYTRTRQLEAEVSVLRTRVDLQNNTK